MITTLLVAVLAGLPEVVITDEHSEWGNAAEIKITLINKTEKPICINFGPHIHENWFVVLFYDMQGRPVKLARTRPPSAFEGAETSLIEIKPGEAGGGYFSLEEDFVIPPGLYQIEIIYRYRPPGKEFREEILSNQIIKEFPAGLPELGIAHEIRPGGGPYEIEITLINKTAETLPINFEVHFYDMQGRPVKLASTKKPSALEDDSATNWIKPGGIWIDHFSPKVDYVIPPGRYQIEVIYRYRLPGKEFREEILSRRISMSFPAGPPWVVIADEHRAKGDPDEIKISLINNSNETIFINLGPHIHEDWFEVRFYDMKERPVKLARKKPPSDLEGAETKLIEIKPGETGGAYFSLEEDFVIPPGRYLVDVVFYYRPPGKTYRKAIISKWIIKDFRTTGPGGS